MKVIVAQTAGFCMGVKRAVDLALEHTGKSTGEVFTLGPLIHNKQTVEMLKERGVTKLDESKPIPPNATILIRAHGVPNDVQTAFRDKGHRIIDGTCPKVKTVHHVIEQYRSMGFAIVITGDEGHAEVIGLQGYAGDQGYLIHSSADVERLPHFDKICLVSQTTFDGVTFDEVACRIQKRYASSEVIVKKTICLATNQRQSETRNLASRMDAMIVVGGKNSANTMRLANIASEVCCGPVQHVETEKEIEWEKIANCKLVGVTAGASTPTWMTNRVVDHLKLLDQTKKKGLSNSALSLLDFCANLNIFVATGAVFTYLASCILQALKPEVPGALILFLYFFSMYLWNSLASIENTRHLDLSRYKFYNARKKALYIVAAITIMTILAISSYQNKYLFYLVFFSILAGSVYHLTIIPKFLRNITRYKSLKDIPMSRDLFVALSWAILITFIPQVMAGRIMFTLSTWFCFSLFFVLAFLRSLIFDLRDIEGDRIMGRETLVTIIGEKKMKKAIQVTIAAAIGFLLFFSLTFSSRITGIHFSIKGRFLFLQTVPFFYLFFFMLWNRKKQATHSVFFNLFADTPFYLTGLCAWLGIKITL
jgi:(E)-4-hydroxy-3-methyl-but-2-enyl pyrophosphate reductase